MAFGNDRSVKLTVAASMDGFATELAKGERSGKQFSKSIQESSKDAAKGLANVKDAAHEVAVPLLAIGAVAAAGVAYAVKSYADFDEKMSSVKSLSHATAGEMELLKGAALTTGTAIGYSATQAADAEIELVKAGVSAADIYGGALAGSLKLAAAGQIDVADATSIAASTLTQFGLKGSDVTHVADLLAAGADKALGGVSDLGEGLKYIGPVAATSNVSLEQTVGTLALLAQNGILGEQAGTGLRGMLLSLTAPSQAASDVMKQYGIEVYDAQGKFVGFNGVAQQLHDRLGTLDDATRDAALGQIFGNAQITTATILMNGGASAVDKWTKAVNEQGFATEQAVGKMDNLNGDLTKLKASFQTAAIVTGEAADGPLRAAVQVVTDMIDTYSAAPGAVQAVVLGVGALTAAVTLGGGTMLIAVPKIVAYGEALSTLQKANLPGVSSAAGGALKAAKGLGAGLGATASFLTGPWGIALAAGGLAVAGFNQAVDSGTVSQTRLTNAISTTTSATKTLELAAQRSSLSKFLVGDYASSLKDLPGLLDKVSDSSVLNWLNLTLNQQGAVKSLKQYGTALSQVAAADAPAAARSFQQLIDKNDLSRTQTLKLLNTMSDYKAELTNQASALGISASQSNLLLLATGKYEDAAAKAKTPTKENADALQQLQSSAEDAQKAVQDLADQIAGLGKTQFDVNSTQRDFEAAIDAATDALKENGKQVADNGTAFDITTDKGRANAAAVDAIGEAALRAASALETNGASQADVTAKVQAGRDQVIQAATAMGLSSDAANRYADQLGLIPANVATLFAQNNMANSQQQVDALNGKMAATPREINSAIRVTTDSSQLDVLLAKIRQARSEMSDLNGASVSGNGRMGTAATGGAIIGPGTGTSDSIPYWLSNGEHVVTAAEVAMLGGQSAMYALRAAIRGGVTFAGIQGPSKQQLAASHASARGLANGGAVTPASYAPPRQQVLVVAGASSAAAPLIGGNVTFQSSGSMQSDLDTLAFELRRRQRGSRR